MRFLPKSSVTKLCKSRKRSGGIKSIMLEERSSCFIWASPRKVSLCSVVRKFEDKSLRKGEMMNLMQRIDRYSTHMATTSLGMNCRGGNDVNLFLQQLKRPVDGSQWQLPSVQRSQAALSVGPISQMGSSIDLKRCSTDKRRASKSYPTLRGFPGRKGTDMIRPGLITVNAQ